MNKDETFIKSEIKLGSNPKVEIFMEKNAPYKKYKWEDTPIYDKKTGKLTGHCKDLILLIHSDGALDSSCKLQTVNLRHHGNGRRNGRFKIDVELLDKDGDVLHRSDNIISSYTWRGCNGTNPESGRVSYDKRYYDETEGANAFLTLKGFLC